MADSSGLPVGADAPEFTAPLVYPDGETREIALSELVAERPVLLVFYTNDFSPDCIEEWCSFRDFDWFTVNDEIQVVGVSKSGTTLHERFIDYLDLGFPLYSDNDLAVAERYRLKYRTFKLFARARRACYLVDDDMTIQYRWLADHWLDPTRDTPPVGEIHRAITDLLGVAPDEADDDTVAGGI
jgi:peroxiredoxin Q/BCP